MALLKHEIAKEYFQEILEAKGLTQNAVAEKLGQNPKSFSRWINEGYPAKDVRELARALGLSADNFRRLIGAPEIRPFFRNKFKKEAPDESERKAVELARFSFSLQRTKSGLGSELVDLGGSSDVGHIATMIRRVLGLPEGGCSYESCLGILADFGFEIAVIPFSYFGLSHDEEQAFTVFNGKDRYVIFLNSDCNRPLLVFNICHELAHIFRSDVERGKKEEGICNQVAAELVYPAAYFESRREEIVGALNSGFETAFQCVSELRNHFNGSLLGVVIRLVELKFISRKNALFGRLESVAKLKDREMKTLTEKCFRLLSADSSLQELAEFWGAIDPSDIHYRFFDQVKTAVGMAQITPRKFAELMDLEFVDASQLAESWRSEFAGISETGSCH